MLKWPKFGGNSHQRKVAEKAWERENAEAIAAHHAEVAKAVAWVNGDEDETYKEFTVRPGMDGLELDMWKPRREFLGLGPKDKPGLKQELMVRHGIPANVFVAK